MRGIRLAVATIISTLLSACSGPAPGEVTTVPVQSTGAPPRPLRVGEPFRVLSWNIQFSAGRGLHFFYDGGLTVRVPEETVRGTLDAISSAVRDAEAALVLLQEVDRDSRRTARIDQLPALVEAAGANSWASAFYHRCLYVPHPGHQHLGRVGMALAILGPVPLQSARRVQLPLLDEPRYRQVFNLHRAILEAEIPVEGLDQPLAVAVTHLSAFSRGDGTMERQVAVLDGWMAEREARGQAFVLAGDLNLLPPGDDPARLGDDAGLYADMSNPMEALARAHRPVTPPGEWLAPERSTYLPYGFTTPDRKIDWMFVGPGVEVVESGVLQEHARLSDHLPLWARLRVSP